LAIAVHEAQVGASEGVSLIAGLLKKDHGSSQVLRHAAALFEHEREIDASVSASAGAALFKESDGSDVVCRTPSPRIAISPRCVQATLVPVSQAF
jgi:hypothetical protein